jgi:hypothetical protein
MPVRDLPGSGELKVLGQAKFSIATATTTSFDFGTPDDINLASTTAGQPGALYRPGDRVLVIFDASTAGTTDPISWVVQDANDSSGSFGTAATAVTTGTLTGGTGDQYAVVWVRVQAGRPWLRLRATRTGTTDTHVAQCTVLAVPRVL